MSALKIMPLPYARTTELAAEYPRAMQVRFPNEPFSYESLEAYGSAEVMVEGLRHPRKNLAREAFMARSRRSARSISGACWCVIRR
jgi:hypothetical protein